MSGSQEAYASVLSTFAYHCGAIMSDRTLAAFGLDAAEHRVFVRMRVTSYAREDMRPCASDQVAVDGKHIGNRCAAREEYARLCAPVIAAAAREAGL